MAARDTVADNIDAAQDWWSSFDFDDFLVNLQESGFKGLLHISLHTAAAVPHLVRPADCAPRRRLTRLAAVADHIERSKEARKTLATATKEFKANRGDPVRPRPMALPHFGMM